jgi:hypothetical protein
MQEIQKEVHYSISLKLSEKLQNSFEYCDVDVPFPNRGSILSHDTLEATVGFVVLSPDRTSLRWIVGQKFPKNGTVLLRGKLSFASVTSNTTSAQGSSIVSPTTTPITPNDPFLTGLNSFIQVGPSCF